MTRFHEAVRGCARHTWRSFAALAIGVLAMLAPGRAAFAWQSSIDGVGRAMNDGWNSVAFHPSGDLIVTGLSYADEGDQFDCTLIVARLAKADGSVVWRRNQRILNDYRPYDCTYAERLLVDASGDVVIGRGGRVTKRSGETGKFLWQKKLGEFPHYGPFYQTTALDPDGNVLFGGGFGDNIDDSNMVVGKLASATGAILWQKSFNGTSPGDEYEFANAIASDADGNVLVLGTLSDLIVVDDDYAYEQDRPVAMKLAADDGAVLWNVATESPIWQSDPQISLVVDASGDVLQRGAGLSILKRSGANGELLWRYESNAGALLDEYGAQIALGPGGDAVATWQMFKGPVPLTGSSVLVARVNGTTGAERWNAEIERGEAFADAPRGLAVTAAGDVLVAVLSESELDRYDFLVVSLDAADGKLDWQVDVDGPGHMAPTNTIFWKEFVGGIALDAEHVATVGSLADARDGTDGVACAFDFSGTESWRSILEKHYPSIDAGSALAILPDGDVVAAGDTTDADNHAQIDVRRVDGTTGVASWLRTVGEGRATSLASDSSGDVVVAGILGSNFRLTGVGHTAVVAKLDGDNGDEQWRFTVDKALLDEWPGIPARGVVPLGLAPNGDVFLAVTTWGKNAIRGTVYRLAASDGSRVWRRPVTGRWVLGMVVDANGDLLLRTAGPRARRERITKLDGTSGETLWSAGTGVSMPQGRLAVTPAGDAIVGGPRGDIFGDPLVLALDGATGARRWRRVLGRGVPPRIATTPSGDVLVAIDFPDFTPPFAVRVLKLDGASGATAWDHSIDYRAETGGCQSSALASDAAGNVLLGGCLDDTIFEITALAAGDGSRLWGRSLVGATSPDDILNHAWQSPAGVKMIGIDALGNVVATGVTADEETSLDFTVVKWSSVDGSDDIALPPN